MLAREDALLNQVRTIVICTAHTPTMAAHSSTEYHSTRVFDDSAAAIAQRQTAHGPHTESPANALSRFVRSRVK